MSRISKSLLMGLGLCMGCGGAMEADPVEGTDELAAVRQELGENGCKTTAPDSLIDVVLSPGDVGHIYTKTSASGSYDHPSACPKQYVVEVRQTKGRNISFLGGWGAPFPASEAECESARAELGVYGRENGAWKLLGTAKKQGDWESVDFFGDRYFECHFNDDPNYKSTLPDKVINASPYDRVRIAAKAYRGTTMYKAFGGVLSSY